MDAQVIAGLSVLILVYVLIGFNLINRTVAALFGAFLVGLLALIFGFAGLDDIIDYIDFETIILLMSMMIIVGILGRTGFFQVVSYKTAKLAGGSSWKILVAIALLTATLSAFLDNVTTILLVLPITLELTKAMDINPTPFILSEIFASNIGGTATLVGDPPNIMIGTQANLAFMDFIYNLAPIVFIDLGVLILIMFLIYGKEIMSASKLSEEKLRDMEKKYRIVDRSLYHKSIGILVFTIALFIVGEDFNISSAAAAFTGATLLLLLTREDIYGALEHVEWPTLLFFAGLFVVVGGVNSMGVLDLIANGILEISHDNIVLAIIAIVWVSAFTSAIIDNIPFTATMIPVIFVMSSNLNVPSAPLFWALSLGACMGGNGTLIGASANVVGVSIAERNGIIIGFKGFLRNGMIVMISTVAVATIYLIVRYVWLG